MPSNTKYVVLRQKDRGSIISSIGMDVLCDKVTSCLNLTLMARSTGIFVNKETTSNDSALRVLPLINSAK